MYLADRPTEIKNPVSLARLLLDHTSQMLSLRRVPPNLLVGQGATDFAYEHGMPVLPHDYLVSAAARNRWRRWREDLDRAERNRRMEEGNRYGVSPPPSESDAGSSQEQQDQTRKAHTKAMLDPMWNEGQPISPPPSDIIPDMRTSPPSSRTMSPIRHEGSNTPDPHIEYIDPYGPPGMLDSMSRNPFANSTQKIPSSHSLAYMESHAGSDGGLMASRWADPTLDLSSADDFGDLTLPQIHSRYAHDGSSESGNSNATTVGLSMPPFSSSRKRVPSNNECDAAMYPLPGTPPEKFRESPSPTRSTPLSHVKNSPPLPPDPRLTNKSRRPDEDLITDTVGAIAIDMHGNIASAASSGGIGMKHRGRVGPAALVGIGAAVIPPDVDDQERTTVATVTSGTGEHMGTTMAANTCSERVYHNVRKAHGGTYEECGDDEAVRSFIQKDFMGHPSVKNSKSAGAIGILSVKKTKEGAWLYFAHNTDSFALASHHADETKPVCTMSRNKGNASIAQGGRAIRYNRKRKA